MKMLIIIRNGKIECVGFHSMCVSVRKRTCVGNESAKRLNGMCVAYSNYDLVEQVLG